MASLQHTEFFFKAFLLGVLKKSWLVVLCAGLAAGLTALMLGLAPSTYVAEGRLLVEARDAKTGNRPAGKAEGAPDDFVGAALASQIELLQSAKTAEIIAAELIGSGVRPQNFAHSSGFKDHLDAALVLLGMNDPIKVTGPSKAQAQPSIADMLAKSLEIAPIGHSQLIKVTFSSPDARLSAQIVNQAMDSFAELQRDASRQSSVGVQTWLSTEISALKFAVSELDQSIASLEKMNSKNSVSSYESTLNFSNSIEFLNAEPLDTADEELSNLRSEREAQQRVLSQFQARYDSATKQAIGSFAPDEVRIVMRAAPPKVPRASFGGIGPLSAGLIAGFFVLCGLIWRVMTNGQARRPVVSLGLPSDGTAALNAEPAVEIGEGRTNVPAAFGLCEDSPGIHALVQAISRPSVRLAVFAGIGETRSTETIALTVARRLANEGLRPIVLHVTSMSPECQALPGLSELLDGNVAFGDVIMRDDASRTHKISAGSPDLAPPLRRLALVIGALSHTYDKVILTFSDIADWTAELVRPDFAGLVGSADMAPSLSRSTYQDALDRGAKSALLVRHAVEGGQKTLSQVRIGEAA